ncbi:T-cell activation inhibitor, mitochondrial-like [Amphibalanus amphitrite]|uniref:T-cell activation inhibitor, mitochondrial-like n=1 Tax=Amphibalanus amphitrite TaxID=1232801 RepID=UPI001C8FC566|nr:T-cell activation inhibitor, mitochondrial-like [Amphibalanus amphitrite]
MLRRPAVGLLRCSRRQCPLLARQLSSAQLAHALRPFYFVVHPDLFHQYPDFKNVNEGSLQFLQAHLDKLLNSKRVAPSTVTFYVRDVEQKGNRAQAAPAPVQIALAPDLKRTVRTVLEQCRLPTTYLDSLPAGQSARPARPRRPTHPLDDLFAEMGAEPEAPPQRPEMTLFTWLARTGGETRRRAAASARTRAEIGRLRAALVSRLHLSAMEWRCGWGAEHFRGCLRSFDTLVNHHPDVSELLRDKTVVFGNESGVSLDGHLILNSGEVITNWISVIRRCADDKLYLQKVPHLQRALSRHLRDIQVVHRKFQPITMVTSYEQQLRRLVTSMGDFWGSHGYPRSWPDKLSHLQLVVESESGPLFLSPMGQIIAPSSCPPSLLVRYITDCMVEAEQKLEEYTRLSHDESAVTAECAAALGLRRLEKQDNILPQQMLACCRRMLAHRHRLAPVLTDWRISVAHYYAVDGDGACTLPWDWLD